MLLALFRRLAIVKPPLSTVQRIAPTTADEWLQHAEELYLAARVEPSPFRSDALYDAVADATVRATSRAIWGFCCHHAPGDPARAEDLAQATFVTFRNKLASFEGRSSLKSFLYGIAHNRCRERRVHDARRSEILAANAEDIADRIHAKPDLDDDLLEQRMRALDAAIEHLTPNERFVVRARLADDLDYIEILPRYRARFGTHIETIEGLRVLFHRAKKRLTNMLRRGPDE